MGYKLLHISGDRSGIAKVFSTIQGILWSIVLHIPNFPTRRIFPLSLLFLQSIRNYKALNNYYTDCGLAVFMHTRNKEVIVAKMGKRDLIWKV